MAGRSLLVAMGLMGLLASLPARAEAPLELHHQGRVLDATGVPLHGAHDLSVRLYDKSSGGKLLWSADLEVELDNGYFAVDLGRDENNPIEEDVFDEEVWVAVEVDGTLMSVRQKVASVPFAIRAMSAGTADSAASAGTATTADTATNLSGGTVDATEVRVNGTTVIDAAGTFLGTDTLTGLGCADGDVPVVDGTDWACAPWVTATHFDELLNVPAGLDDGDQDTLGDMSGICGNGQFPAWDTDDAEWYCGDTAAPTADEIIAAVTGESIALALGSAVNTTVDGDPKPISTVTLEGEPNGEVTDWVAGYLADGAAALDVLGLDASSLTVDGEAVAVLSDVTALQSYVDTEAGTLQANVDAVAADLATNYYGKTDSDSRFLEAAGDTLAGTLSGGTVNPMTLQEGGTAVYNATESNTEYLNASGGDTWSGTLTGGTLDASALMVDGETVALSSDVTALETYVDTQDGTLQADVDAVAADLATNYYGKSTSDTRFLEAAGDTLTGTLSGGTVNPATLQEGGTAVYNATESNTQYLNASGGDTWSGTLTGGTLNAATLKEGDVAVYNKAESDTQYLDASGGDTWSGTLTGGTLNAAVLQEGGTAVYSATESDSAYLNATGDTVVGDLTVSTGDLTVTSTNALLNMYDVASPTDGYYLNVDNANFFIMHENGASDDPVLISSGNGDLALYRNGSKRLELGSANVDVLDDLSVTGTLSTTGAIKEGSFGVYNTNESDSAYVNVSGDTLTGTLSGGTVNPTTLREGGTDVYNASESDSAYVNVSGDTVSGNLTVSTGTLAVTSTNALLNMYDSAATTDGYYLRVDDDDFHIYHENGATDEPVLISWDDGDLALYRNGTEMLRLDATDIDVLDDLNVTGTLTTTGAITEGSYSVYNSSESNSAYVNATGDTITGSLTISSNLYLGTFMYLHGSTWASVNNPDSEVLQIWDLDDVELYYNNSPRMRTTSGGINVIGTVNQTSDERLKQDIAPLDDALSTIGALDGVSFHWRDPSMGNGTQIGFIAQDVQDVLPELVDEGDDGMLSVNYSGVIPVLVEAVKELEARVADLEQDNRRLEQRLRKSSQR